MGTRASHGGSLRARGRAAGSDPIRAGARGGGGG
eukprot:COSAG04_NODE_32628_length_204_cov_2.580952_1_plen_33_part_10